MLKALDDDPEYDYETVNVEDYETTKQLPVPSTAAQIAASVSSACRSGFIYGTRTFTGCLAVVTLAPRATPFVMSYIAPTVVVSTGVLSSTTTAAVGVVCFGVGSQIGSKSAEAVCDLSSNAITYMFSTKKSDFSIVLKSDDTHTPLRPLLDYKNS